MTEPTDKIRIDKWLWASRIFKTRNQAAEACRKGRVFVDGTVAKPSRTLQTGCTVVVRKPPAIFTYQVEQVTAKRQSAILAKENFKNLTPREELDKLHFLAAHTQGTRDKGSGRPTKKERRMIDRLYKP